MKLGLTYHGCALRFISTVSISGCLLFGSMPTAQAASTSEQRVTFTCPNGLSLSVEFVTGDPQALATVRPSTGPVTVLPSLPSGDGFRYGDAGHELRGRGREVVWTAGPGPAVNCKATQSGP